MAALIFVEQTQGFMFLQKDAVIWLYKFGAASKISFRPLHLKDLGNGASIADIAGGHVRFYIFG